MGWASGKELEQIRNTSDQQALTSLVSAQIAKANNPHGPISDSDQRLAEGISGAGAAGNPGAIKDALNRYVSEKQNEVTLYNSDADIHLRELNRLGLNKSEYLQPRKVGGDIGKAVPEQGTGVNPSTAPTNSTSNPGQPDTANTVPSSAPTSALSLLPGANKAPVSAAPAASAPSGSYSADQIAGARAELARRQGRK